MSNDPFEIFERDDIMGFPRGVLQRLLTEREQPATGTTDVLRVRLLDWQEAYSETLPEDDPTPTDPEAAEKDTPPADPAAAEQTTTDTPPADPAPADPEAAEGATPPAPEPPAEPTPVLEDEGVTPLVRRRMRPGVASHPEAQPASAYVAECEHNTLVRLHSTPVVQVLKLPFGPAARGRAYSAYGLDLKSFVNEELAKQQ